MDPRTAGTTLRAIRIRRRWSQAELALRAGCSRAMVSRVERGSEMVRVETLQRVARALDAHISLTVQWRGADLPRLLGARHSAFHEVIARRFAGLPGWAAIPEVSFSRYGERGVVDVLAFHAATATVLVVELKTAIVEVQEMLGTLDRKRRHARKIAEERGWAARHVAIWLAIADSPTKRRRVEAHRTVLRAALPDDPSRVGPWLRDPTLPPIAALSFVSDAHGSRTRNGLATPLRVPTKRPRHPSRRARPGSSRTTPFVRI